KIDSRPSVAVNLDDNDNNFEDKSTDWLGELPTFSNGTLYADLDNDGDMDLVVNDVDGEPLIYENQLNQEYHFLGVSLDGPATNPKGIGTKVILYQGGMAQTWENFPANSYLSYSDTRNVFGLGQSQNIDSLIVIWPGGRFEKFQSLAVDQYHVFSYKNASGNYADKADSSTLSPTVPIDFTHSEKMSLEFDRNPLLPFAKSNEGPSVSVTDVNGDGLDDVFLGGAKRQAAALFIQTREGTLERSQEALFDRSKISEDTDHVFFDADGDGDQDLLVVAAGNEFKTGAPLRPRLYLNDHGELKWDSLAFSSVAVNASVVKTIDIENDGDRDVFIGCNTVSGAFGEPGKNYLFANMGGGKFVQVTLKLASDLIDVGLVEDADVVDIDGDGDEDLILAGHWMPITIMINDAGFFRRLTDTGLESFTGWWNVVIAHDFDGDGDMDIVGGNWGLNSRLSASVEQPVKLYRDDFDNNGSIETVLTYFYGDRETTLATKDELVRQLPGLNKKFLSYRDFAEASVDELFGESRLNKSDKKIVTELASCYFENQGGNTFIKRNLPAAAQVAPIHSMLLDDFDHDGRKDLMLVGNSFEISTQLARQDALRGLILFSRGDNEFEKSVFPVPINGAARDIARLDIGGEPHLIVTMNNGKPIIVKK
ncbi:MAG: FG-GAP-like repeat-containing protein, partial [Bacteroidota bacterium]